MRRGRPASEEMGALPPSWSGPPHHIPQIEVLPRAGALLQGGSCSSSGPIVSGIPKPEVTWFLDGVPVRQREGILELNEEAGSHYLCLLKARLRDSGRYSCTASNSRGQVACSWNLMVQRESNPPVTLGP